MHKFYEQLICAYVSVGEIITLFVDLWNVMDITAGCKVFYETKQDSENIQAHPSETICFLD